MKNRVNSRLGREIKLISHLANTTDDLKKAKEPSNSDTTGGISGGRVAIASKPNLQFQSGVRNDACQLEPLYSFEPKLNAP
jgi:hypothetical protein